MSRLHPRTKLQLDSLEQHVPQGILLHGQRGAGVREAAKELAHQVAADVQVHDIMPEKTGITIEQVRELYILTRTSTGERRVFVLHDADQMSHPAQTAFLKLLEEPTDKTTFLLISHEPQKLLPTIHSRVQAVEILPLTSAQTTELLDELAVDNATIRAQLIFIADGLPEELERLASDTDYRTEQFNRARQAKELIQGTLFDKLKAANSVASDRQIARQVVGVAAQMLAAEISRQPSSVALIRRLQAALRVQEALGANGNVRAQLLRFVITP